MKYLDLFTNKELSIKTLLPLGSGAQGESWKIVFNNEPEWVLKTYRASPSSHDGRHLAQFVRFIGGQPKTWQQEFTMPMYAVRNQKGDRVGCLMRYVQGIPLDDNSFKELYKVGLRARLQAALSLTKNVLHFHQKGIVIADIGEVNAKFNPRTGEIQIFDLDGGGIQSAPGEYFPYLHPLVRGRLDSYSAPELLDDPLAIPTIHSDTWSLTTLIHKVLLGGLDPFFAVPVWRDTQNMVFQWPMKSTIDPTLQKFIGFHLTELKRLGASTQDMFKRVFSKANGNWSSVKGRPSASDWKRVLNTSLNWVSTCASCKQEFVSERALNCPLCGAKVPPAVVWTTKSAIYIDREGKSILGSDLGFTDRQGKYQIACFGKRNGELMIFPTLSVWEGKKHLSGPVPIHKTSARKKFRARSANGQREAEFRVVFD